MRCVYLSVNRDLMNYSAAAILNLVCVRVLKFICATVMNNRYFSPQFVTMKNNCTALSVLDACIAYLIVI